MNSALFLYLYAMKTLDEFQFKQFSVRHAKSGMKVGTDAVLLGVWADFVARNRILDVGAGTGILALMAAQRNADAMVDAVEIDAVAAEEALQNAENSAWSGRIKIFECDFLRFESGSKYDYIVSNPPFFDSGERAPDARRAMARHTDTLPFSEFFGRCKSLLSDDGLVGLIAPAEVRQTIEFWAGEANLWLRRRTAVRTTLKKPIRRYLWEFSNLPAALEESEIVLQEGPERSREFKMLTEAFYIH